MLWRQGDIYISSIPSLPTNLSPQPHCVLAEGEVTGHSHRVDQPSNARLYSDGASLFLEVVADSPTVIHEEHGPIMLGRGTYRVWRQREYSPEAIRVVRD